jgi:anti-anti-sigma factor
MSSPVVSPNGQAGQMPLAQIERSDQDGVRVIAVSGELDISNIDALRQAAFDVPNEALGIVLDLCAARHIDSATVRLLFELQHSLQRRRQALRIVYAPGSIVERVIELAAFDSEGSCARERAQAVTAIRREVAPHE